jgi:hypothetical protein
MANRLHAHARAYDLPSIPALIAYLHGTAGFPVKSTWLAAIKRGAYTSWPGLTHTLAARYCPDADETVRGHMAQPRQHIRSTHSQASTAAPPPLPPSSAEANSVELHELPINSLFTDDTGRFQPRARSGNQYIMVALHTNSNAILVRPFASKKDAHRIAAYTDIYTRLATANQAPALHIMDNEASAALQRAIATNNCKLQLVPPHVHRRNAAERAIRTFKDHFLAILRSPLTAGTYCSHTPNSRSTYSGLAIHPPPPHPLGMPSSDISTLMLRRWDQRAVEYSSITRPPFDNHGTFEPKMVSMSDQLSTTIGVTACSQKHHMQ